MKPRTKAQKEVDAIRHNLPDLTGDHLQYIYDNLFSHYMYKTKHQTTCFSCGRRWDNPTNESALAASLLGDTCPSCGRNLKLWSGGHRKRTIFEEAHIRMITTYKNYQVFRYWYVQRRCKVGQNAHHRIEEVQQEWIRDDGKWVDVSILVNSFGYYQNWRLDSSVLEIRQRGYQIDCKKTFPKPKILKIIRRNGYSRTFHNLNPAYFCHMILTNPKAETLLKAKQIAMFNKIGYNLSKIEYYWPSIKIAIRHHYTIQNASDWIDHLDIMEQFDMDILNPKLICLDDFTTAHQRLVDKRNRAEAKRRYEEEKKQIAAAEKGYKKAKERYFKLKFEQGNIVVAPLTSVQEFYDEAEAMHHCVSGYHKRDDSLILSAKDKEGKRLETIEVSLRDFSVLQCRGLKNEDTKHHDKIVELVEANMKKIKKAHKSKTDKK